MNVGSKVVFTDADNPESGQLWWYHGDQFTIADEYGQEVDVFNVCRVENTTYSEALHVAEGHFKVVLNG